MLSTSLGKAVSDTLTRRGTHYGEALYLFLSVGGFI